jgi:hypothetical protein
MAEALVPQEMWAAVETDPRLWARQTARATKPVGAIAQPDPMFKMVREEMAASSPRSFHRRCCGKVAVAVPANQAAAELRACSANDHPPRQESTKLTLSRLKPVACITAVLPCKAK